jgi:hypothetical protein
MFLNSQLTPEAAEVFLSEWAVVVTEVGWEAFQSALTRAIRNSEFFPSVALIRKHAGLSEEQLGAAECDIAWESAKKYADGMRNTSYFVGYDEATGNAKYGDPPPSPGERIEFAIKQAGGAHHVRETVMLYDQEKVKWLRRDFDAAYMRFPTHKIVTTRLALAGPEPARLQGECSTQVTQ